MAVEGRVAATDCGGRAGSCVCSSAMDSPRVLSSVAAATGATVRIHVTTRGDLGPVSTGLPTSSRTGRGIPQLRSAILRAGLALAPRSSPATTRLAVACEVARRSLAEAAATAARGEAGGFVDESLLAAGLRRGAGALADVTGAVIDVDLLDRIFSRHCIGK